VTVPAAREIESRAEEGARRRWLAPPALRGVRAAFVFLTRVPVGGFPYRRADWAWAAAHAPLVGLVVGAFLGGVDRVLLPLGPLSAAFLVLGVSLLVTGAFHEDGLADTSDALGGAHDAQRVLEILKDSRIGTFGAAALVVSIAGRAALLAQLGASGLWALPLAGCAARVGPIWLLVLLDYVTSAPEAKSRDFAGARSSHAAVATAWFLAAAAAAALAGVVSVSRSGAIALAMVLVTCVTGFRYRQRTGGITGDFLGATEQLCELAAFAVLAWRI
jgi:adenosylcobinamide-GDP ribazoletransferase